MTRRAAVAVIGGGVIGASVAYHLANRGMRNILVIDAADKPGQGSTGKATGGFRAQFATAVNVQLSLDSRERLLRFRDETGVDPGYSPVGYLWLAGNDRQLEMLRAAQTIQHAEGLVEARELAIDEAATANPCISLDGIAGCAFCPTDGYIRPLEILRGYIEAGARLGVETIRSERVTALETTGSRISRVRASGVMIDADVVVNAAGAWAAGVASMAGVHLPVAPLRRQAAVTVPTTAIPASMPMTIFMDTGFHLRARDGHALLCWPTDDTSVDESRADDEWIDSVETMKRERVPALRNVAIDRSQSYAGLYEMSPDHHAIVGFAPGVENLFLVNGSSGHGVMHSPALGAAAAAMICGADPAVDVSALRPSRFAEGAAIAAGELL